MSDEIIAMGPAKIIRRIEENWYVVEMQNEAHTRYRARASKEYHVNDIVDAIINADGSGTIH